MHQSRHGVHVRTQDFGAQAFVTDADYTLELDVDLVTHPDARTLDFNHPSQVAVGRATHGGIAGNAVGTATGTAAGY